MSFMKTKNSRRPKIDPWGTPDLTGSHDDSTLLVSPLVSLTIAKFNGLSVHCSVVAQLYTYTTFEYLVRILLHVAHNLRKHYNFTEI